MADRQFDDALLARIKESVPLPSLIGQHVKLERSGRGQVGCCPFHGEKTPSFHVYSGNFHCFGCGAHGDAIDFMRQMQGYSFTDAVRDLARSSGIDVPGKDAKPLSVAEQAERSARSVAFKAEMAEQRQKEQAQRQQDQEAIRVLANKVWSNADPADPQHPYLVRKGIDAEGLRQDNRGNLLVPRYDGADLWNIERILPERPAPDRPDKYSLSRKVGTEKIGGRTDGLYTTFGDLDAPGPLAISTGMATSKSVRAGTEHTTLSVGSDSNLMAVALTMRERFPDRVLLIAGDNDHRKEGQVDPQGRPRVNGGKVAAMEAAEAVGGIAVIPPFAKGDRGSDWNDYMLAHGSAALRQQFAQAITAFARSPRSRICLTQPPAWSSRRARPLRR